MNILHSSVGLLPQLHVDCSIQLDKLSLRVVQVDCVSCWVLFLDDRIQVIPQFFTALPELR